MRWAGAVASFLAVSLDWNQRARGGGAQGELEIGGMGSVEVPVASVPLFIVPFAFRILCRRT
jgi:hypothetical protein